MHRFAIRKIIVFMALCLAMVTAHAKDRLVLLAPSSMTEAAQALALAFEKESGLRTVVSVAGTQTLARQLDSGLRADLFLTADKRWMDWVAKRQGIVPTSVRAVAGNSLVLAVRSGDETVGDWKTLVTVKRFAMAEPQSVPAGRYAEQALNKLGLWADAKKQAVFGENVRITLRRLALGEVAAAVVYETDVAIEPKVQVFHRFAAGTHEPVVYLAATPSRNSGEAGARKLMEFVSGPSGRAVFKTFGFLPVEGS